MKMTLQTIMQKMTSYVELVLSEFLLLVVVALSVIPSHRVCRRCGRSR